ncbi:HAD domain-containing protein [Dactylosporangium sp. NPDC051541]|uniref:HAD domain-containing protein n=1 Tax=Dactylosporangium sp. NPDC051541 TaxID=3363977 RepID=UPI00379CE11B
MDDVPVWLLDVDGVINVKRPAWGEAPFHDRAYALGAEWKLRWAPGLLARIRRLHREGLAEVRWCSTWCAWPGELERVFKVRFDRAFGEVPDYSVAKLAAALAVMEGGRRLVWTDDVEVPLTGLLFESMTLDDRALLIRPDDRRGLTPADLDAIEAFCRRS